MNKLRERKTGFISEALQAFHQLLRQLELQGLREGGWVQAKAGVGFTLNTLIGLWGIGVLHDS